MHARFFVFFFFFLFLLLFAGHRQISGRLLGGPRHHGPKFGVLPASAPHVQVLFFPNFFYLHFVYFQPQPRMSKYCFFQIFFIYILCTSSLSPACLSTPPYFQPQPRMSVNLFLQISFLLTASAAHVRGFVFSFLFFYFQHQARMSKCCVLQSIFI
jgi:hypothetical protein